jgi:hypothetical protein
MNPNLVGGTGVGSERSEESFKADSSERSEEESAPV